MSFSARIRAWRRRNDQAMNDKKREIILRLFRAVIYDTPVLEGTLRANWRCSANASLASVIEYRPAEAVLSEVQAILNGAMMEDTIYLRNNLPYAYRIEYLGWSRIKAPQGMVRKNVIRFNQIARRNGMGPVL